jgi:monofunctional biosynthetic peptidoglycan transglycosylase
MTQTIFSFDTPRTARSWKTVDDEVMGGRSHSRICWFSEEVEHNGVTQGILRFEGNISLENNGGFCSTRTDFSRCDLAGVQQLRLLVRGDGKRYKFTVRSDDTPQKTSWRLPIEPPAGRWHECTLQLADFELWRRGTHLSSEATLDSASITSLGLLISDEQKGSFHIDIARIAGE